MRIKTKMSFKTVLLSLFVVAILASCNDEKNESAFEVSSDVYIIKKKIDGSEMYGVACYAYSNKVLESAIVTPPGGSEIELSPVNESVNTRAKEPQESDFSPSLPDGGSYLFEVTSAGGETIQNSDDLELDDINVPVIDSLKFNGGDLSFYVGWQSVSGAEAYVVKLLDNSDELMFVGLTLDSEVTDYNVRQETGTWLKQAYAGDTVAVQVAAFTFDSDATNLNFAYNLKEMAVGETKVIWGE